MNVKDLRELFGKIDMHRGEYSTVLLRHLLGKVITYLEERDDQLLDHYPQRLGPQPETEDQKEYREKVINSTVEYCSDLLTKQDQDDPRSALEKMMDSQAEENDYVEKIQKVMYKEDGLLDENGELKQSVHCDPLVLHAPGLCGFCDQFAPERQQLRIKKHVNFTGEYDEDKTSCPSEYFRPAEIIHRWGGNTPKEMPKEVGS